MRVSRTHGLAPLAEVADRCRKKVATGRSLGGLHVAFHLREDALRTRRKNDVLVLYTEDKAVRFALTGMEGEILGWLHRNGHDDIRRVAWSAE
jgi:hypothetical protein